MSPMNLKDAVDVRDLRLDPDVRLLDVRWELGRHDGHDQYLAGHLPGAVFVDLKNDLADPVGDGSKGRHPLPESERFAAAMRRCGVSRAQPVVVYDGSTGAAATRAWWLLRYHGHPDVRVLDGGFEAYQHKGGHVEAGEVEVAPGDFTADPGHLPVLDAEGAARVAREGALIDVRAPERFRGDSEPIDPVAGHIPGAVNRHFADINLFDSSARGLTFRIFDDTAFMYGDVLEAPEIGVYCGSGVTATHTVFTLHRLGVEAALYPGSWSEWVSDPSRPVATGD